MRVWFGAFMAALAAAMLVTYVLALRGFDILNNRPWLFFTLFAIALLGPSLRSRLLPPPVGGSFVARQLNIVAQLPRWSLVLLLAVVIGGVLLASATLSSVESTAPTTNGKFLSLVLFVFFFTDALLLLSPQRN